MERRDRETNTVHLVPPLLSNCLVDIYSCIRLFTYFKFSHFIVCVYVLECIYVHHMQVGALGGRKRYQIP